MTPLPPRDPKHRRHEPARILMILGLGLSGIAVLLARSSGFVPGPVLLAAAVLGYVLWADGWVYRHRGESLVLSYPGRFGLTLALSLAGALLLEAANRRLGFWSLTELADLPSRVGAAAAWALLLPALLESADLVESAGVFKSVSAPPLLRASRPILIGLGVGSAALAFLWPSRFSLLWWAAPLLAVDPLNERRGDASFLADARIGQLRKAAQVALGGLLFGILWEAANHALGALHVYGAVSAWRLFGLPTFAYALYPLAGLGAYAAAAFAAGTWDRAGAALRWALSVAALVGAGVLFARFGT